MPMNIPINLVILLAQPVSKMILKSLVRKKGESSDQKPPKTTVESEAEENTSNSDNDNDMPPSYLIVDPKKGNKRDILKYLVKKDVKSGVRFLDSSEDEIKGGVTVDHRWVLVVSIIIGRFLAVVDRPLKLFGCIFEFFLNLISQNDGFSGILNNFPRGKLKIPRRGTEHFISTIGHLDGRIDLYRTTILAEKVDDSVAASAHELGNRYLMDLCIMASKLAYENVEVVKNVVNHHWKMQFEAFYNCWNESQKASSTQVFMFSDKPKDANLILISFRGTKPFNARDWNTDFDFSWYEIPKVGKIHIGFLEALGLGNRDDATSFQAHLHKKNTAGLLHLIGDHLLMRKSAYNAVLSKLKSLLKEHEHAKFVVTGHSLGGALAILFASVLAIQDETEVLQRLLNVYTFGQPQIGDSKFGIFMESHLNYPVTRYFRVVYCNDMVPRVPFDGKILGFKHFGQCLYFDSHYFGQFMNEEPNRNYFGLRHIILMQLNAMWEVLRSFVISHTHGEEYQESWFCTFFRIMGLVLPGVAAHSPINYVNSVRLGRRRLTSLASLKSFTRKL